jgi:acetyltransferase-like isoleucine patch superfamily enzyme
MFEIVLKPFYKLSIFITKGKLYNWLINNFTFFKPIVETQTNETPIPFKQWLKFKVLKNESGGAYFPIHPTATLNGSWRNVLVGIDASPTASPGCYVQALGKIYIGDYAQVAPNVGIISSNHFMLDIRKHVLGKVVIGKYCRIGMGSIIHSNVVLGDFVTVAAGSVVTQSFENGYCVIAGNPAKIVEDYSTNDRIKSKFLEYKNEFEYNGFIPAKEFEAYRKKHLKV